MVEPDESIQNAVQEWIDNGLGDRAAVARDAYGVEDPEALFASFEPYIEKWRELISNMDDPLDEDELTQVFYDNLYGELDPAEYGMN